MTTSSVVFYRTKKMEQTSRLSIVVDASNAEANIERLRTSLRNLSQDAINASQRIRDIARHNPFGGLNPQTIQSINNFNHLNQTINNNSTAFNNFSRTINTTNNHFGLKGRVFATFLGIAILYRF